ncbi:MAG: GNAT family N-acetyltransferase [Deltaproteobacteria bacterium]|jgi:ribosomal protein S18 acetylase RimI-like enzyme|nr:GNAT family N-acetyltransferase [Deltaproteobacteria bacterium]
METDERQVNFDFGPPLPRVRTALETERKTLLEVIGRAFFDDPIAQYVFPDERSRIARYGRFANLAIDAFGAHGQVLTNEAVQGAAIWQAPSPAPIGFWKQLRMSLELIGITRSAFLRAARLGELVSRHHPTKPHWYLAILGTDPDVQGQGIGSALLRPTLERCDQSGTLAYLESSKEANIPFYSKYGFELLEEIQIPSGPKLWPMLRRARQEPAAPMEAQATRR